jgi:hypothetical protein
MKNQERLTDYERELLETLRGKKFYCNIVSVSRSGMTRKMKFYAHNPKFNELCSITYLVGIIAGYNFDKNGDLIVSGCGMDMVFSVVSNFNYAMAKLDTGKSIQELLQTKECGEHIYDKYFTNANNIGIL